MITVIAGTNRLNSKSEIVARRIVAVLSDQGEEVQLLSLSGLPPDFVYRDMFGKRRPEFDAIGRQNVQQAAKFVFVIPEYNGSFPGVLKAFVDAMEPSWFHYKKAALIGISSGRAGSLRSMDQFTNVLNYLKVHVHFSKPKISRFEHMLDAAQTQIVNEECLAQIDAFAAQIRDF